MIRKTLVYSITFLVTFFSLEQVIELSTHGFWVQRMIAEDLGYHEAFATPPLLEQEQKEIQAILAQPFYLMGAGSECFAFESADHQYVLKCFKLDHFRPVYLRRGLNTDAYSSFAGKLSPLPSFYYNLPSYLQKALIRIRGIREFRIDRTFQSILLAYNHLKEETALVYAHLNPSSELSPSLTLYDSCHIAHTINPNQLRFVLQKKATPLLPYLETVLERGNEEEIRSSLSSFVDLLLHRCQAGIGDRDIVARNFGFCDKRAIEIDTGSFSLAPEMKNRSIYLQELTYATLELKAWLMKKDPALASLLSQLLITKTTLGDSSDV